MSGDLGCFYWDILSMTSTRSIPRGGSRCFKSFSSPWWSWILDTMQKKGTLNWVWKKSCGYTRKNRSPIALTDWWSQPLREIHHLKWMFPFCQGVPQIIHSSWPWLSIERSWKPWWLGDPPWLKKHLEDNAGKKSEILRRTVHPSILHQASCTLTRMWADR